MLPEPEVLTKLCAAHPLIDVDHDQRMKLAQRSLIDSVYWNKQTSGKFVFIHSKPLGFGGSMDSISPGLGGLMVKGQATILTSSLNNIDRWVQNKLNKKQSKQSQNGRVFKAKATVIPLRASRFARAEKSMAERSLDFSMFDSTSKDVLKKMRDIIFANSRVDTHGHRVAVVDERFIAAKSMAESRACLVFDFGDSSEGLQAMYDALQTGCTPVMLFASWSAAKLPFMHHIDWLQTGIAGSSLKCYLQNPIEFQWLIDEARANDFVENHKLPLADAANILAFPETIYDVRNAVSEEVHGADDAGDSSESATGATAVQDAAPAAKPDDEPDTSDASSTDISHADTSSTDTSNTDVSSESSSGTDSSDSDAFPAPGNDVDADIIDAGQDDYNFDLPVGRRLLRRAMQDYGEEAAEEEADEIAPPRVTPPLPHGTTRTSAVFDALLVQVLATIRAIE